MPIWQRMDSIVPMFALAADTLNPATAPGVTSYADPAYRREVRLRIAVMNPGPLEGGPVSTTLHDGGLATFFLATGRLSYAPGTDYDIATFDILDPTLSPPTSVTAGAATLPSVADETALAACPSPGCYLDEPGRLRVRLFAADEPDASVAF
jgi:hypothetical protein